MNKSCPSFQDLYIFYHSCARTWGSNIVYKACNSGSLSFAATCIKVCGNWFLLINTGSSDCCHGKPLPHHWQSSACTFLTKLTVALGPMLFLLDALQRHVHCRRVRLVSLHCNHWCTAFLAAAFFCVCGPPELSDMMWSFVCDTRIIPTIAVISTSKVWCCFTNTHRTLSPASVFQSFCFVCLFLFQKDLPRGQFEFVWKNFDLRRMTELLYMAPEHWKFVKNVLGNLSISANLSQCAYVFAHDGTLLFSIGVEILSTLSICSPVLFFHPTRDTNSNRTGLEIVSFILVGCGAKFKELLLQPCKGRWKLVMSVFVTPIKVKFHYLLYKCYQTEGLITGQKLESQSNVRGTVHATQSA